MRQKAKFTDLVNESVICSFSLSLSPTLSSVGNLQAACQQLSIFVYFFAFVFNSQCKSHLITVKTWYVYVFQARPSFVISSVNIFPSITTLLNTSSFQLHLLRSTYLQHFSVRSTKSEMPKASFCFVLRFTISPLIGYILSSTEIGYIQSSLCVIFLNFFFFQ